MTHEEAADVFECMGDDVSYLADYLSSKQIAAIPIAARVLRERAEGEKGVEQACDYFCEQQDENFWCEKHRNIVEKTYHAAFHAGRASLAAEVERLRTQLAAKTAECAKAVDSIWECRVFLRGCMNHAFDETPIVEVAKDVSEEFHRNRYQIQCIAKERDNIARERDAANLLLKRLMCVVVPDNAVPNDMKEFVRDSAATVLKDLWDYLKTDADLRKAEHDAG